VAYEFWGKGYATEGAKRIIEYVFNELNISGIVSFTVPDNQRSWRVMEKLGLSHDPDDDFLHPKLPKDHILAKHVLYKISNPNYL